MSIVREEWQWKAVASTASKQPLCLQICTPKLTKDSNPRQTILPDFLVRNRTSLVVWIVKINSVKLQWNRTWQDHTEMMNFKNCSCFCMIHPNLFSQKSDPGPLGPVYIILLVLVLKDFSFVLRSNRTRLLNSRFETGKTLVIQSVKINFIKLQRNGNKRKKPQQPQKSLSV